MVSNPGFSFTNINGKYKIVSIEKTDFHDVDPLYSEAIVCDEVGDLVTIYSEDKVVTKDSDSIAFKFAKINISRNNEILDFCSRYGLIMSERNFANFRNDYLFFESKKDEFTKRIPLVHKERDRITDIKKSIIAMRYTLSLSEAINNRDFETIIKIITYFCFDLTNHFSSPDALCATELYRFNRDFRCYCDECGYEAFNYQEVNFTLAVTSFLAELEHDEFIENLWHANGQPYRRRYIDYDFTEWRHIKGLFEDILSQTELITVEPFGEVKFSKPFSEITIFKQLQEKNLLNLARAVLSDLFKEKLHTVYPEIQIENGKQVASWRIPTLLDAMYLELFFRFSPTGQVKRCADPSCDGFFTWTPSRPTQKYCCNECALRVAKREQRKREKLK